MNPQRPARILLFDDSRLFLAVTGEALETAGYEVLIADNLESLEAQRKKAPDLLLMDVQTPEAFGDDVAAVLRALHGVEVPILLLSSLEVADLEQRAREAEIDGFISKQSGLATILTRVREALEARAR
jgi:CheY-like chemotaxis protein